MSEEKATAGPPCGSRAGTGCGCGLRRGLLQNQELRDILLFHLTQIHR